MTRTSPQTASQLITRLLANSANGATRVNRGVRPNQSAAAGASPHQPPAKPAAARSAASATHSHLSRPGQQPQAPLTSAQRLDIFASGLTAGFEGRQRLYGAHRPEMVALWYDAYDLGRTKRLERDALRQAHPVAAALGWRVRPLTTYDDPLF